MSVRSTDSLQRTEKKVSAQRDTPFHKNIGGCAFSKKVIYVKDLFNQREIKISIHGIVLHISKSLTPLIDTKL